MGKQTILINLLTDVKVYHYLKYTCLGGTFLSILLYIWLWGKRESKFEFKESILFLAGLYIVKLPWEIISNYELECFFLLSQQPVFDWIKQYILAQFLTFIFLLGIINTLNWLIKRKHGLEWIIAGAAYGVLLVVINYIFPVWITPLFNKVTPASPCIKDTAMKLAKEFGLNIDKVYIIDASRQTTTANAYIIGIWKTNQIVIYDTLLKNFTTSEIKTVLAHELAHKKEKHLIKGILLSWILCIVFLTFIYFKLKKHSTPKIILYFILFSFLVNPFQLAISRKWEKEADLWALKSSGNPQAIISTFTKLSKQNMADPNPSCLEIILFYSHPPISERIKTIEEKGMIK